MNLLFNSENSKQDVFSVVTSYIGKQFSIGAKDENRPWGGFLVIDEKDTDLFISTFFSHLSKNELGIAGKLSPKILIVAPHKKLSWQYHHRRAEIWKLIAGKAGVVTSDNDEEGPLKELSLEEIIELKKGERHRLVGLDNWGIIAEIWRHTDADNPSDEEDIVRVQDDFGR